jgi:ETC complex I subunit conserved region
MLARIYQPAKTAMQSGRALTKRWVLEYEPERPLSVEPLMGWTSSGDMRSQIALEFDSRDEAVAYARRHEIPFQVFEPNPRKLAPKSYSDNFRFDRKIPWTH